MNVGADIASEVSVRMLMGYMQLRLVGAWEN